jgi:hypothetical protein
MAITKIPAAGFTGNNFRNIIINGDMSIAQRGTSATGVTSNSYNTCDRWNTIPINLGTWTLTQSTDVPTGQGFASSFKLDCTTADASPSASDFFLLRQKIEGQNLQYLKKGTANAQSLTMSFWVKSNKTGTYIAELLDDDNTRQISAAYTVNVSDTWEKKIITFPGDTTGTLDNDNGNSLAAQFWLGAGSDYSSGTLSTTWTANTNTNRAVGQVNLADSTANEWYVTGVQLEAGTTASDFEFLPVDVNLRRCQRYYESTSTTLRETLSSGRVGSTNTNIYAVWVLKTEKRAAFTASASSTASGLLSITFNNNSAVVSASSSVTFATPSKISAAINFTIASSATAHASVKVDARGDNGYFLIADSEL